MAIDSTAMAEAPASTNTATGAPAALDTEPTAGASDVAEGPGSGDDASQTPTPDRSDTDGSAEDQGDDEDAAESERPESERKLTRSQRQALRQQEAIDKAVADALAKHQSDQQAAAERQRQAQASTEAQQAKAKRLAEYLGEPDQPGSPGTIARLTSEINDLNRQIRAELTTPQGADLDALAAAVAQKETEVATYQRANALAGEIEDAVFDTFRADFTSAKEFPELAADPAKQAAYLHAQGGVRGALHVLADTIRSAKDAEWSAKLAASEKVAADKLAAMQTDRDGWRVRAGGAELPTTDGGSASNTSGLLTPDSYASMSYEERMKLRATPEGRARIDAMMARR